MKTLGHKILQPKRLVVMVLLTLVLVALCVAGCAPSDNSGNSDNSSSTRPDSSEQTPSQSIDFTWSADGDCSICHTTEHSSFDESKTAASQHATLSCFDCHTEIDAIEAQHESVSTETKMTTRLKKTSIDDDLCLACHNSYDELATKTAGSTVFTDNYGTVVNPHDLPSSDDHDSFSCARCHDVHLPMEAADYQDNCLGCHHANVYECGTCH